MKASDVLQYPFQMDESDLLNWNGNRRYWDNERLYKIDYATFIKKLKHIFSKMGIPEAMRSDNEPQYSSSSFKKFAKDWRFQHMTRSPEYPRSNGLAQKTIQTVKTLLEKAKDQVTTKTLTLRCWKQETHQLTITDHQQN